MFEKGYRINALTLNLSVRPLNPDHKIKSCDIPLPGGCVTIFKLASGQGRSKFQPQEYIDYFEDCNFHLTPRWGQRGHCDTASGDRVRIRLRRTIPRYRASKLTPKILIHIVITLGGLIFVLFCSLSTPIFIILPVYAKISAPQSHRVL